MNCDLVIVKSVIQIYWDICRGLPLQTGEFATKAGVTLSCFHAWILMRCIQLWIIKNSSSSDKGVALHGKKYRSCSE